ncbi:hypothetical protein [Polynucleobacter sp. AP-Nino-20-G2]|uniref:hypothetical protein n=1 Tax=Polynucleobacter sp. AP-Nino-20-G2 TaxID=2576917 RepID=UPI001BFECC71|nr:hypothetical protein [Polynucleobacter sp. AP-Nino-20-G2]QWE17453.1 hypothetical protein FD960_04395 [Polynucleobacter sp. AP-Nino-20-G2]
MAARGAVLNVASLINAAEFSALIAKARMRNAVGKAYPVGADQANQEQTQGNKSLELLLIFA